MYFLINTTNIIDIIDYRIYRTSHIKQTKQKPDYNNQSKLNLEKL